MNRRRSLKLRMIADFALIFAFGFAAPTILAPIGRNWSTLATGFVTFLFAAWFLYDGLRTRQRLQKYYASQSTTES